MNNNVVKEKLLSGKPVIGMWSIINSAITTDIAAHAGLDFQILDMEHGVFDLTSLDHCIRACESQQCSPIVRVPSLQPTIIQNCLDLGAHGIIVPQIKDSEEAQQVVKATKFAPLGTRGFNPFTRAGHYNPSLPLTTTKLHNDFALTGIILENKKIFDELDYLLTLPHLDLFYLGIYDLSFDLGLAGNVDHPFIAEYVAKALQKIKQAGKFAGLMVKNPEEMKKLMKLGANFIVYSVDTHIYYSAIQKNVQAFKQHISDTSLIS